MKLLNRFQLESLKNQFKAIKFYENKAVGVSTFEHTP